MGSIFGIPDMWRKSGWEISQNTDQISKYRPQYRPFWAFYPQKVSTDQKFFHRPSCQHCNGERTGDEKGLKVVAVLPLFVL